LHLVVDMVSNICLYYIYDSKKGYVEMKNTFEKLGEHLFYLTQDADLGVYDRWKEIGLTEEFAEYIANLKNKIEREVTK